MASLMIEPGPGKHAPVRHSAIACPGARHAGPADAVETLDQTRDALDFGALRLTEVRCDTAAIARAEGAPSRDARIYQFLFLREGSAELHHFGQASRIAEGDLVLCDGLAPMKLLLDEPARLLVLHVSAGVLKAHLPSPEFFCGKPLKQGEGLTTVATMLAASLMAQFDPAMPLHHRDRVARHLLDVIATAYGAGYDHASRQSSIVSGRCAAVKLFIERHLREPDLSPCAVADRLKLSPRYLRMIFASESETVSAYILRRRLEQCARQIADPAWRGHSMTEIAFSWGFNSSPHFTRAFRDRFAMAPRDYRRRALEREALAA